MRNHPGRRVTRAVLAGSVVVLSMAPASAHVTDNTRHNWRHYNQLDRRTFYHKTETYSREQTRRLFPLRRQLAADTGTLNADTNPVDWSQLKGVPADFADGVDDTGATGPATDVDCAGCVGAGDIAGDAVSSAHIVDGAVTLDDLSFDPATQAELDAHKTSADHDGRYALIGHDHGREVVVATSATDSEVMKSAFPECPAGKVVVGGGARVESSPSGGVPNNVVITRSVPAGSTWWATAREVGDGWSGDWFVEVHVICLAV